MKYHSMERFTALRSPADEYPEGGSTRMEGLAARLAAFASGVDPNTGENPTMKPGDPIPPADAPKLFVNTQDPPVDPPKKEDPPAKSDDPPAKSGESGDLDFPVIGKKVDTLPGEAGKQPTGFDEATFDLETDRFVKELEAKGHPGEVYRQLKSQIKDLTKKSTSIDPNSIPEVVELKKKVEDLSKVSEEVETLREKNKRLMLMADETAIRESDEFIKAVTEPIAGIEDTVVLIAQAANLDPKAIFDIITEKDITKQDKALEKLESVVGRRNAGRVERFIDDYATILKKQEEFLGEATKRRSATKQEQLKLEQAEKAKRVDSFRNSTKAAFVKYAGLVPGFLDGTGQLSPVAKTAMDGALDVDIHSLDEGDLAYLAFTAKAIPEMRKVLLELQRENMALKAGKPGGIVKGSSSAPTDNEDNNGKPKGLLESMRGKDFVWTGAST